MINILIVIVTGLFCMKIVWNLLMPYVLVTRALRSDLGMSEGISLMPIIEIVLWLIAIALSHVASITWLASPLSVAGWGAALIVGSYVPFLLAAAIAAGISRKSRDPKSRKK